MELARFMHDIQGLAMERQKDKLNNSNWAMPTFTTNQDAVSLKDIDRSKLSPSRAKQLVDHLLHYSKERAANLGAASFLKLIEASSVQFVSEPTLIDLSNQIDSITMVGDMHGSLNSLKSVLELVGDHLTNPNHAVVINGDYIDRGSHSVEVLLCLLLLKLAHKDNIFLLRGNHENEMVSSTYGFKDELKLKYGSDTDLLWNELRKLFARLPIAIQTDTACIMHGGIPKEGFALDELRRVSVKGVPCGSAAFEQTIDESVSNQEQ